MVRSGSPSGPHPLLAALPHSLCLSRTFYAGPSGDCAPFPAVCTQALKSLPRGHVLSSAVSQTPWWALCPGVQGTAPRGCGWVLRDARPHWQVWWEPPGARPVGSGPSCVPEASVSGHCPPRCAPGRPVLPPPSRWGSSRSSRTSGGPFPHVWPQLLSHPPKAPLHRGPLLSPSSVPHVSCSAPSLSSCWFFLGFLAAARP